MQIVEIILTKIIPLFTAVIGFGSVIFIHEFGHFIFCKIFGINTPTFSIGWGPSILNFNFWGTNFQIAPLPVGGYCEIDTDEEDRTRPGNFHSIGYLKKMLIILGGIFFNLAGAFGVYTYMYNVSGMPSNKITCLVVKGVSNNGAAFNHLFIDDQILGIEKSAFEENPLTYSDFQKTVAAYKGKELKLLVKRDPETEASWINIAIPSSDKTQGILGINLQPEMLQTLEETTNFKMALTKAWTKITLQITTMASNIFNLLVKEKNLDGMAGPVMILSESFKIAATDFLQFLLFMSFMSINLALLNFLPLGVLDGGRALTVTLETIVGRPLTNLAIILQVVSIAILGSLFFYLTAKELYSLAIGMIS